jgi:hypothetical protein
LLNLVSFELCGHVNAERQVKMLDSFIDMSFLFRKSEDVFVTVQCQVKLVATLLNFKNGFLQLHFNLEVGSVSVPFVKILALCLFETVFKIVTKLFKVLSLLLGFPVVS